MTLLQTTKPMSLTWTAGKKQYRPVSGTLFAKFTRLQSGRLLSVNGAPRVAREVKMKLPQRVDSNLFAQSEVTLPTGENR